MAARKKPETNWRQQFIAKFPQFQSIIDGAEGEQRARSVFGDEIVDLILDVASNPGQYDFTTQAGLDAFDAAVYKTKYFNETAAKAREFDALTEGERNARVASTRARIARSYGDLYLTRSELDLLATEVTRRGLDDVSASYLINYTVGGRKRGKQDLLDSLDGQAYKKIARSYGYNPPDLDDQVISALTGREYNGIIYTEDTLRQKAQTLAKATYFNLAPMLDAGLTVEDIFDPYRKRASQVLELPEDSISLDDVKFARALSGAKGQQMTMGEWEAVLKSDPSYGYQFTATANKDAGNIATALLTAFGKVR